MRIIRGCYINARTTKEGNTMILWLAVSKDKYELPLAVADTAAELGRMIGVSGGNIRNIVNKHRTGKIIKTGYIKLEFDDTEDE